MTVTPAYELHGVTLLRRRASWWAWCAYHRVVPYRAHRALRRRFFCPRHRHEFRTYGPGPFWTCSYCHVQVDAGAPEAERQRQLRNTRYVFVTPGQRPGK